MNYRFIKIFLFTQLYLFTHITGLAQVITTEPEYPLPDESVTITFYADMGNAALQGHEGEIYAHTGVITSQSTSPSDWKYVKTEWGENTDETQLLNISGDVWELTISPSVRDYYGVPASETIQKMAFVFRNADGSIVAREANGDDIFANVYSNPDAVTWNAPDTTKIYSPGDSINIDAVVLSANTLTLQINGVEVDAVNQNSITYSFEAMQAGTNTIQLTAVTPDTTIIDSIQIFVRDITQTAELPSQDLKDGINYIDSTTVTLVLYAPYKEFVFVKGSFDNWSLDADNQMYRTPDSTQYWITLNGLNPGQEYPFYYIVDGEISIADPYADKVLDPWNDPYISDQTYPNLIEYPEDKAEGIISVFQTAQSPYNWQMENFEKPDNEDLIIYEMLIRDFVATHNYQTLTDTIQYLKNLGVNAIELMPVSEFEGNSSWGYNPSFYFAPDKYYGTKNKLKAFIDTCHQNGIAVILDMVLNHSFGQSPLVQLYFDPSAGEYGQPAPENPWYNEQSPNPTYYWGFDFDHESPQTQKFVNRVTKYWLTEYKFDGFRFDFTKGFTNTPGEGWSYDQSRIDILKRIADTIWNTSPGAYVILEHLTANSEEKVLANYGMMLWGNLNHAYCQASMGYADGSDFSNISYKSRSWSEPNLVGYMESHDEERQMYKNITWGDSTLIYNIKNQSVALRRAELTSLFFLPVPGPKMIWQFGEVGYDYSIDYDCRVCEKPIRWDYFQQNDRKHLYEFYNQIIELRNADNLFRTDDFSIDANSKIKTITFSNNDKHAIIIGNFGVKPRQYTPDLDEAATWFNYFENNSTVSGDTTFTLQPGRYKLLINEELNLPDFPAYPDVTKLNIEGNSVVNDTLKCTYTYYDLNDYQEGETHFQWYRSDDSTGTNKIAIENATTENYIVQEADAEKYLSVVVVPESIHNKYTQGLPAESSLKGPVTFTDNPDNSSPVIFPVPANDYLKIVNVQNFSRVKIFNNIGQPVNKWQNLEAYSLTIDISGLQSGVYFLQFEGEEQTQLSKIIKAP